MSNRRPISFRVPVEMAEALKAAAVEEGFNQVGPLCRELLKWAFSRYTQAGSLFLLKKSKLEIPRWKP